MRLLHRQTRRPPSMRRTRQHVCSSPVDDALWDRAGLDRLCGACAAAGIHHKLSGESHRTFNAVSAVLYLQICDGCVTGVLFFLLLFFYFFTL